MSICKICNGAKKVTGIGFVKHDCANCGGSGVEPQASNEQELKNKIAELEAKLAEYEPHYDDVMGDIVVKPRGRPKKV